MFVSCAWRILACLLAAASLSANDTPGTNCNPILNTPDTLQVSEHVIRHSFDWQAPEQQVMICQLLTGQQYTVTLNGPEAPFVHAMAMSLPDHTASPPATGHFSFVAPADCIRLSLRANQQAAANLILSIACDDCPKPQPRTALLRQTDSLTTTHGGDPVTLVQDVFIGGDCFDVLPSSIRHRGSPLSRGTFEGAKNVIDMEEGVLLSTGNVRTAEGPNQEHNASAQLHPLPMSDADLRQIVGNGVSLRDISALEFDFVPTSDQILFEYVFASEEYCEYAGSNFNDVFGFFISGPGIDGPFSRNAENIARIPGSSDYVTINNLNHYTNESHYVNNVPAWHHASNTSSLLCDGHTLQDGDFINDIEYDGFTRVLTAIADVQPCETYHIKLIIADVDDGYYDSAVFLKANSFRVPGAVKGRAEVPALGGNLAYEDCTDAHFAFQRTNRDLTDSVLVRFALSPQSSAELGRDFLPFPDSIVIPAGDSVAYLPISILPDGEVEGQESIILDLEAACSCQRSFLEMLIQDAQAPNLQLEDVFLCEADTVLLQPVVEGGLAPFQYRWSNGATTAQLQVQLTESTRYAVWVTDACGREVMASAELQIVDPPEASLSGNEVLCAENNSVDLLLELEGIGPWQVTYRYNDTSLVVVDSIASSPHRLVVDHPGTYELLTVSSRGCPGRANGRASVSAIEWQLGWNYTAESCPGKADGQIHLEVAGGSAPYQYLWNRGVGTVEDPVGLLAGSYELTVIDANGCQFQASAEVPLNDLVPSVEAGAADSLTCRDSRLYLSGSGSQGSDYVWQWLTVDGRILEGANRYDPLIDRPGRYRLSITHLPSDCSLSDDIQIGIDTTAPIPQIDLLGPQVLDCRQPFTVLDATASQPMGRLQFQWQNEAGDVLNTDLSKTQYETGDAGLYRLTLVDTLNGCRSTRMQQIASDQDLPYVSLEMPGILNCKDVMLQLDAGSSDQGPAFQYRWTTSDGQLLSGEDGLYPWVNRPGNYQLTIVNIQNSCWDSASLVVNIDTLAPLADAGPDQWLQCDTREVALDGSGSSSGGNYQYWWSTADGQLSSDRGAQQVWARAVGRYQLEVTDASNHCVARDEVVVAENPDRPQAVAYELSPPFCFGELGLWEIVGVSGGLPPYLYSLDGGQNFVQLDSIALEAGSHRLVVQDANGCQLEEVFDMPGAPPLWVEAGPSTEIPLGATHRIVARTNVPDEQIAVVEWTPSESLSCGDCLEPLARPLEDTRYQIRLQDDKGCEATDVIDLWVDTERNVYIPNAFSPNDDGVNDHFTVFSDAYGIRHIRRMQIFDRWGGLLYDALQLPHNQPGQGWDGTAAGQKLNTGVFVYLIEVEFVDGVVEQYQGDVTLLRSP
ncbi:MAG: choice-of-anchor L domain-containing protein [Bacteroidota bacterium]